MRIRTCGLLLIVLSCQTALCGVGRFEIPGFKHEPARRTIWTRWLNTFDYRKGAGDPDYHRGPAQVFCRPSNYRTMAEGRFDVGAPLWRFSGRRTQMTYMLEANCSAWQATIELFVRSKPGINIWNDGKEHHVLHLYGAKDVRGAVKERGTVSLVKTADNMLRYQCQGTTIALPVGKLKADQWYHIAISWDAKYSPGRLWLTVDGKGVTADTDELLRGLSYAVILFGNAPRETDKALHRRYGEIDAEHVKRMTKPGGGNDDFPLMGIIDEIHITDESLADRLPARRKELRDLPIDWELYHQTEDYIRMLTRRLWPNELPLRAHKGNKYGGLTYEGMLDLVLYEAFGDMWFLDQAQRVGKITLRAQQKQGHFPMRIWMEFQGRRRPNELGPTDIGLSGIIGSWPKYSPQHIARLQDGFQDVPMSYLLHLYRITGRKPYLEGARKIADLYVTAQNPNGSWSGSYDLKERVGRIADNKSVTNGGEFDDGGIKRPFWSLILMHHVTGEDKYLESVVRCADWILEAEIVNEKARGWAGFYNSKNEPVYGRGFELPHIYTTVFFANVGRIMMWAHWLTGDKKYMEGIRPAFEWLKKHRDPKRGWASYYNWKTGEPIYQKYFAADGYYGPAYGHFVDLTYIEEAMAAFDAGTLRPRTGAIRPTPGALAQVRAAAIKLANDKELLRWVRRDVAKGPNAHWVRRRHRLQPDIYGLYSEGDLDKMVEYLLAVRVAADKVPPGVSLTGSPMPERVDIRGMRTRCWFVENWFDTPLRKGPGK